MPPGRGIPYRVVGEYNGKMLYEENLPDEAGQYSDPYHSAYYLMDLSTSEKELLLELKHGSTLWIAQGYHSNQVFPDGTLLYMNYHEDKADIYSLDLNTGESTFLFTDDEAITFRIFGEYNGGFFGKHKDHQDDMRFYWISKEDFYAGNLDAAIMYQL